jgi:putative DNA primase/helicase
VRGADPFDVPDFDAGDTARTNSEHGRNLGTEREAIVKLFEGDISAFVSLAKADPGFPFEPEAIGALSRIARADFERLRARLKADSQVRLPALEAALKVAAGGTATSGDLPGRPITFDEIKPWPEPVDGAAFLTEIVETIGKYVIMDPHQRDAAALGAVFAHTHDLRATAPIFFIVSPTKRCGKTRLERVIKRLVPKPLMASGATPAFLARAIEKHRPTVLIDEYDATAAADQAMAETLRGQLNSSFDRDGATVGKCVPLPGGGYDEREFSTWAATWIAGIKKIPETVEDRSVVLRLIRKLPGEKVARFRGKEGGELEILKRKIARFVVDNEQRLRDVEPDMPEALSAAGDRAPDAWEPLVVIGDVAGGAWRERARNAALALAGVDAAPLDGDVDGALLSDLNHILNACDAFGPTAEQLKNNKQIAVEALEAFSHGEDGGKRRSRRIVGLGGEQLTNALATFVESKWPTWDKGKPMRPHQLARLLGAYGVRSQSLRDGEMVFRRYPRDRLEDAIERYITCTPLISGDFARYGVTRPEKAGEIELYENVTGDARNASENAGNANEPGGYDVVTPKKPRDEGG